MISDKTGFASLLTDFDREFERNLDTQSAPGLRSVFQFRNDQVLKSNLETGVVRLYDARNQADEFEVWAGIERLMDRIPEELLAVSGLNRKAIWLHLCQYRRNYLDVSLPDDRGLRLFVLCARCDNDPSGLGQFGDNYIEYSLEDLFRPHLAVDGDGLALNYNGSKVRYGSEIETLSRILNELLAQHTERLRSLSYQARLLAFPHLLEFAAIWWKDDSFRCENEYRIVVARPKENVVCKDSSREFLTFKLRQEYIKTVFVKSKKLYEEIRDRNDVPWLCSKLIAF